MKRLFTLLAVATVLFTSCTTAYKTGQTPDDVYFSPETPREQYVSVNERDRYEDDYDYYEDRMLRMKVRNRDRWSEVDDWYYYNNRYAYYNGVYPVYWNSPWNGYSYWNYYYNPYCPKVIVVNPKNTARYNTPRKFNLNSFNNPSSNTNSRVNGINNSKNRSFGNSNSNRSRDAGRSLRDIFRSSGNSNSNSGKSPAVTPSSSNSGKSSGSSGSSGGGNAPKRKF